MLKRKIIDLLIEWKNTKNKECLLVKGARQVGKTYTIRKFGEQYYKKFVYINFFENEEYKKIFDGSLSASEIYKKMSIYIPNVKLEPKNTLIFLDEIQECPNARTALKFLAIDNQYDVIASGSLLGIKTKNISSIPVGYESQIMMYPLDFEEFLWATGRNEESIAYIKEFFSEMKKVDAGVNDVMQKCLREYMIVGGMPEVVNTYISTNNYGEVHKVQKKILSNYDDDIAKYAENVQKPKIRKCYNSIPTQLAKENKKFQYSTIEKGTSERKFGESLQWLIDANLVVPVYNVSNPTFPLEAYAKEEYFKLYANDIGLLVAMYPFDMKSAILDNTLKGQAKGGIFENLVADIFSKKGYKLFYYKNENNTQEIEFLLTKNAQVVPVEVKAGNNATVSLNEFIKRYNPPYAIKLTNGNIGKVDKKITLPLYMAMFL